MRLTAIHIDGYGIFHDFDVRNLSHLNHIVYSSTVKNIKLQSFIISHPTAVNVFYNSSDSADNVETVSCHTSSFFSNQLCFATSILKRTRREK